MDCPRLRATPGYILGTRSATRYRGYGSEPTAQWQAAGVRPCHCQLRDRCLRSARAGQRPPR
eukprot:4781155-Prymnesium_polylepis.1